jgi:adenylosuccinate synthase
MKAVIGLGFGDEGKGLVTSYLCHQALSKNLNPIVVRFNGGHQAGHTVVYKERKHVFSSFGSGTLQGVPTYWSKHCTIYPASFFNERSKLLGYGIEPVIYVNPYCPVTTPYDLYANRETVSMIGGTVGMGFGTTLQRQADHYCLYAKDLAYENVVKEKVEAIRNYYQEKMGKEVPPVNYDFIKMCLEMSRVIKLTDSSILQIHTPIYEGAQGTLLDQHDGFFPNVTRSNTTVKNIVSKVSEVNLVMRSYLTRHGKGYFPDLGPINLINNEGETNVQNPWQGDFKITSHSVELLEYAVDCNLKQLQEAKKVKVNLFVTCCDQYSEKVDDIIVHLQNKFNFNNVYKSSGPSYTNIVKTIYGKKS